MRETNNVILKYSTETPDGVFPYQITIWPLGSSYQIGVVGKYQVSSASNTGKHPLFLLNSAESGYPDNEDFDTYASWIVSASKKQQLILQYGESDSEVLAPLPIASDGDKSSYIDSAIYIRIQYSISASDLIMTVKVTDALGFVLISRASIIQHDVLSNPTETVTADVFPLPQQANTFDQGDIHAAGEFTVSQAVLSEYKLLRARYYGSLPADTSPQTFASKELAVWQESGTASTEIRMVLPVDELLADDSENFTKGTLPANRNINQDCLSGRWWYKAVLWLYDNNTTMQALSSQLMNASEQGKLYVSPTKNVVLTSNDPYFGIPQTPPYSSIPGAFTVNVYRVYHQYYFAPSTWGDYEEVMILFVRIFNSNGEMVLATAEDTLSNRYAYNCKRWTPSVWHIFPAYRQGCPDVNPCQGDNSNMLAWLGDATSLNQRIGNDYTFTGTPGVTVALPQGDGSTEPGDPTPPQVPAETAYAILANVNTGTVVADIIAKYDTLNVIDDTVTKVLYMPYLGNTTMVHRNSLNRVATLGIDTYYYPIEGQPNAIGFSNDLLDMLSTTEYNQLLTGEVMFICDDDLTKVTNHIKSDRSIIFQQPSYITTYRQDASKAIYYFAPNATTPTHTGTIEQHDTLSLDSSLRIDSAGLFDVDMAYIINRQYCKVEAANNTYHFTRVGSGDKVGASIYKSWLAPPSNEAYQITHSLSLATITPSINALTGVISYPSSRVVLSSQATGAPFDPLAAPYLPEFIGQAPPNYKAIWIDWSSLTDTTLDVHYWDSSLGLPTHKTLTLNLLVSNATTLIPLNGANTLNIELTKNNDFSDLRIFASEVPIAEDFSNTLPWIRHGTLAAHVSGDFNDLADFTIGDLTVVEGAFRSDLDTPQLRDYISLQVETIDTPINTTTAASLNLAPYTVYWDIINKELYLPVMTSPNTTATLNNPVTTTRLAKTTFFKGVASNYPPIVDLIEDEHFTKRITMSDGHGIDTNMVIAGIPYNHFSSRLINEGMTTIKYYWRRDTGFTEQIGPFYAEVVSGVEISPNPTTPTSSATSDIPYDPPAIMSNATLEGSKIILDSGISAASAIWEMTTADKSAPVYALSYTRKSLVHWSDEFPHIRHFGVVFLPYSPEYIARYYDPDQFNLSPYPVLPYPYAQLGGFRVLFGRDRLNIIGIHGASYKGYSYDESDVFNTVPTLASYDDNAIISIEVVNNNGKTRVNIYQNGELWHTKDLDIPYFNQGSLCFYSNVLSTGSKEIIDNISFDQSSAKTLFNKHQQHGLVYCVPTRDTHTQMTLAANEQIVVYNQPTISYYGYTNISLINTTPSPAKFKVWIASSNETTDANLIGEKLVMGDNTLTLQAYFVSKGESILVESDTDGVSVRIDSINQL